MSMDLLEGHAKGVKDYGLERLIMLSDGVFAIAITLLALEIRPPEGWDRTFMGLLQGAWRELLAYVLSFFVIAIYWATHRRTFQRFHRSDPGLTALNFVLLALITLLPFGSRLLAEGGPTGQPVMIYFFLVAAIGVSSALMFAWAAFVAKVTDPRMTLPLKLLVFLILLIMPTMMAAGGLTLFNKHYWWVMPVAGSFAGALVFLRRRFGREAGI